MGVMRIERSQVRPCCDGLGFHMTNNNKHKKKAEHVLRFLYKTPSSFIKYIRIRENNKHTTSEAEHQTPHRAKTALTAFESNSHCWINPTNSYVSCPERGFPHNIQARVSSRYHDRMSESITYNERETFPLMDSHPFSKNGVVARYDEKRKLIRNSMQGM